MCDLLEVACDSKSKETKRAKTLTKQCNILFQNDILKHRTTMQRRMKLNVLLLSLKEGFLNCVWKQHNCRHNHCNLTKEERVLKVNCLVERELFS